MVYGLPFVCLSWTLQMLEVGLLQKRESLWPRARKNQEPVPEDPARGRDECWGFNSVPLFQILGSTAKGILRGRWKGCFETLFRSFHSLVQNSPMDLQLIQSKTQGPSRQPLPHSQPYFPPFPPLSHSTPIILVSLLSLSLTQHAYSLKAFVLVVTAFWLSLPLGKCMADCLPSRDTITFPILTL